MNYTKITSIESNPEIDLVINIWTFSFSGNELSPIGNLVKMKHNPISINNQHIRTPPIPSANIRKYNDLENFFICFLSSLSPWETEILLKTLLKYFSFPKESISQIFTDLENIVDNEDDLKNLKNYDLFRWTIKNWKEYFLIKDR